MGPAANEALEPVQDGGADDVASALSTGGFDYARAVEAVEAADLSGLRERSARDALAEARDDPEAREAALARVRRLLGIE
jgi:hypothetical protein